MRARRGPSASSLRRTFANAPGVCFDIVLLTAAATTMPLGSLLAQNPPSQAVVTGTVEAFVLPPNALYTGSSSVTDLTRLPYAKVTVSKPDDPATVFVGETATGGTFSVETTFTPSDATVTVAVSLERASGLVFNLSTPADDPPLVLSHTQKADQPFEFTDSGLGAFNAEKTEFGTAQATMFFYLNEAADFANSFASAFTPPYATPPLTGQPNQENEFSNRPTRWPHRASAR